MTAAADRRVLLEEAAEHLFARLRPEKLADLVGTGTQARLRDAAVHRAELAIAALRPEHLPVEPAEFPLLVACTLTSAGVAKRTDRVVAKFLRFRALPGVAPEVLVEYAKPGAHDDPAFLVHLRSEAVLARITAPPWHGEPFLLLSAVAIVVVEAFDPADEAEQAGIAVAMLDRASELTAAYRAERRPVPTAGGVLPVIGNAQFLVRMAAIGLAVGERVRGPVASLDRLQVEVARMESSMRAAMRSVRDGTDQPDVGVAFRYFAQNLASAAGVDRDRVAEVYALLNPGLLLPANPNPPKGLPVQEQPVPPEVAHVEIDHLVHRLITACLAGLGPVERPAVVAWLSGRRPPDRPDHLRMLVGRVRLGVHALELVVDDAPGPPAGVTADEWRTMVHTVASRVDVTDLRGGFTRAHTVARAALPPLWTRRRPVYALLARGFGLEPGPAETAARRARLVAAHTVRSPAQFVRRDSARLVRHCCGDRGNERGGVRQPVAADEVCRHRPWGEDGAVGNHRSLAEYSGFSLMAVPVQLSRLRARPGWWSIFLLGDDLEPSRRGVSAGG